MQHHTPSRHDRDNEEPVENLFELLANDNPATGTPEATKPTVRRNLQPEDGQTAGEKENCTFALLQAFFLGKYSGFRDRRVKDPSKNPRIKVDDRTERDIYPGFCHISVMVPESSDVAFVLELINSPYNAEVQALVGQRGRFDAGAHGGTIYLAFGRPGRTSPSCASWPGPSGASSSLRRGTRLT